MKYHFRVYREKGSYWGECLELKGCVSQGKTHDELVKNLKEALDLYLDEPEDSHVIFAAPKHQLKGKNIIEVDVDPQIALASLVRTERLKKKMDSKSGRQTTGNSFV